jgi:hypothetical protein
VTLCSLVRISCTIPNLPALMTDRKGHTASVLIIPLSGRCLCPVSLTSFLGMFACHRADVLRTLQQIGLRASSTQRERDSVTEKEDPEAAWTARLSGAIAVHPRTRQSILRSAVTNCRPTWRDYEIQVLAAAEATLRRTCLGTHANQITTIYLPSQIVQKTASRITTSFALRSIHSYFYKQYYLTRYKTYP